MLKRFHPTDPRHPRWRRRSVPLSAVAVPSTPVPPLIEGGGDTIYIPWGFYAQVTVFGRDEGEVVRDIEHATFESSDPGIVNAVYARDTDMASLYPVSVGTTTVIATADAAAANEQEPVVPITKTLTVVVHRVATRLVLYYIEEGATEELLVPVIAGASGFALPINTTATVRVEGQDAQGNVVPLTNLVYEEIPPIQVTPTSDPSVVTVAPDTNGFGGFNVTADGDPSPGTATLTVFCGISAHLVLRATHLVATYSIVPGLPPPADA